MTLELIKPIIIGNSIDKFINGYKESFSIGVEDIKGSFFYDGVLLEHS